ncbi:PQQ-dependent sugar dehydrogenase, partial [Clostridium saudiense]|nr:PQQ-dependent sugar dehydrogenase [Clostridium saudiense]
ILEDNIMKKFFHGIMSRNSSTIRAIEKGILNPQPLFTFGTPFVNKGEGGLMGIVLDPNYSTNHYIYVMHSYREANQIYNRVARLVENNNRAYIDKIIIEKTTKIKRSICNVDLFILIFL